MKLKRFDEFISEAKKYNELEEVNNILIGLPIDETASFLTTEIMKDIDNYYTNDIFIKEKIYTYQTTEELKDYSLKISFQLSNNSTSIGYAQSNFIEIKILNKESIMFKQYGNNNSLDSDLKHIIKHECSHFYLDQKIENSIRLYYTHKSGLKKYYDDVHELVLHSREIVDRLPLGWEEKDIDKLKSLISKRVANLPGHTNIYQPFSLKTQEKYINFIMDYYIKPKLIK